MLSGVTFASSAEGIAQQAVCQCRVAPRFVAAFALDTLSLVPIQCLNEAPYDIVVQIVCGKRPDVDMCISAQTDLMPFHRHNAMLPAVGAQLPWLLRSLGWRPNSFKAVGEMRGRVADVICDFSDLQVCMDEQIERLFKAALLHIIQYTDPGELTKQEGEALLCQAYASRQFHKGRRRLIFSFITFDALKPFDVTREIDLRSALDPVVGARHSMPSARSWSAMPER